MNSIDIKNLLHTDKYSFLHTNEHIKDKIILLTLGGSYAYGTNTETSDIDIRGIALNSKSDILGFTSFDQFESRETDTVIYSLNKIFQLLMNCNPNVIEMLGNDLEYYFQLSPEGQLLISNKQLFLSQRAIKTFGGYAYAQLNRLMNALGRNPGDQSSLEQNLLRSLESSMLSFNTRYNHFENGMIRYYIDDAYSYGLEKEVFCDVNITHYPLREFNGIISDNHNILKTYDKLNHRNTKKDIPHLCKHAMHLVRLYLMGCEILEEGTITTRRVGPEHDLLMAIRNQQYMTSDDKLNEDFFELVQSLQDRFRYACENTALPVHPNDKVLQQLLMHLNLISMRSS